ncbi:MAG: hypothetical protein H0U69_02600 [Trueperaceae bacterium]|nr:hypothetical protein [Trueperaceae bacterium]
MSGATRGSVRRSLRSLRHGVGRLHTRYLLRHELRLKTWWRHGRRHAAPIDPFRVLMVDPATIRSWLDMERDDFMRIRYDFGVRDGDWDLSTTPFSEHFVFSSIAARFTRAVPWSDTRLVEVALAGVRSGDGRYHGCTTEAALETRLRALETLHEHVRRDGYKAQSELARQPNHPLLRRRYRPPELDEVLVDIGRDGEFILVDGVHRFSVARVLEVPRIPVCVLVRHAEWQRLRDRAARAPNSVPETVRQHPDIEHLLGRSTRPPEGPA